MEEVLHFQNIEQQCTRLFKSYKHIKMWFLNGELGVGKTTLIHQFCSILGVNEAINSPTFSLVNKYEATNNTLVYHLDLYRLNKLDEYWDLGVDEQRISGKHYFFIEWGDVIKPIVEGPYLNISLNHRDSTSREMRVSCIE